MNRSEPVPLIEPKSIILRHIRKVVLHLHRHFTHPPNPELARFLEKGCAPDEILEHVMKLRRAACEHAKIPKSYRKVAMLKVTYPGQGITMDVFHIYDRHPPEPGTGGKKRPTHWHVQHYACLASAFQEAGWKAMEKDSGWTADDMRNSVETHCFVPYGTPECIVADEGSENTAEIVKDLIAFYDVKLEVIAGQAP